MSKTAIVTAANQGLGLALVRGLASRLNAEDTIYLTARDRAKGIAAMESLGPVTPNLHFERLDVTDKLTVADFARLLRERHRGIDIVASNAAGRISKERPQAEQARAFIETNNHGSKRVLDHLMPLLNPGARYAIVASSFGRLSNLPSQLHARFDTDRLSLDDIEATMDSYVDAMENGSTSAAGWPDWINIPSKIGQVVTARAVT